MESDSDRDSDKELQIALSKGLLQPGTYLQQKVVEKHSHINNESELKAATKSLHNGLSWVERLDLSVDPAPAPKAISVQLGDDPNSLEGDDVHNDFKREMKFYRIAQAAVLEGLARLKSLGVPTKRPNDYMAEMAKSDEQMKKVREKLLSKTVAIERREKAKKLRDLRKYGKKVQTEVLQKRQKEKRQMMDAVKKYRKGQIDKLDFLENNNHKGNLKQGKKGQLPTNKKRQLKNQKFGFGGQKKRSKYNTSESARDMSDFNPIRHQTAPGKVKKAKAASKNRPGKMRRQKMKNIKNSRKKK